MQLSTNAADFLSPCSLIIVPLTELLLLECLTFLLPVAGKNEKGIVSECGNPEIIIFMEELQLPHGTNTTNSTVNSVNYKKSKSKHQKERKELVRVNITYDPTRSNTILGNRTHRRPPDVYTLNCRAPYLTRWTTTIVPKMPGSYGHSDRFDQEPLLEKTNSKFIFSSQLIFRLPQGGSGHIQCEAVRNSSLATKVHFFSQVGKPIVRRGTNLVKNVQAPINTDTRNNFIVPCRSNYPNVTARLVKICNETRNTEHNVSDSDIIGGYNPQVGFVMKGYGSFQNECNRTYYRCKTFINNKTTDRLTYEFYNPYVSKRESNQTLQLIIGSQGDDYPLGIWCKIGGQTISAIKMIRCNSVYECDWTHQCFYDDCEGVPRAKLVDNRSKSRKGHGIIADAFPRGKVICSSTGLATHDYLFTGLDKQRYWLLSSAKKFEKSSIISVSEIESPIYSHDPVKFSCETSTFVLFPNIKFAAVFKNGSRLLLDEKANVIYNDFSIRKEIVTNVTADMVAIMCLAPWLNSSDWVNTSSEFEVKDAQAPSIERTKTNAFIFYIGDKIRSLFCNASGEPKPTFKWTVPNAVAHKFGNIEDATLHFPVIQDLSFEGGYVCTSMNIYGTSNFSYTVKVEPPRNDLIGSAKVIIPTVCIIALLAIGLIVLVHKYIRAKKLIMTLTTKEVNEFLNGRLYDDEGDDDDTFVQSAVATLAGEVPLSSDDHKADKDNPSQQETEAIVTEKLIHSMKFDFNFEIVSSDLTVDSLILGQGNFGLVSQGSYKGKPVAVKTTKSDLPDKLYLMALLSEIKIMQYIGKWSHPNIIQYLGAVIKEIQRGKVFVVVELSPFGSLEDFLKNIRKSGRFINLVGNGRIKLGGYDYEEVKKTNTVLNLVQFCEQIASGMNFLTSKKVIHGDLAARNVLMFENGVVKITDFGLSKKLYSSLLYQKKLASNDQDCFPVSWMAIESLMYLQFSSKSDVWSFGVTAWEIFTLGQVPVIGDTFQSCIQALGRGEYLRNPDFATETIYLKLRECWRQDPDDRPSFSSLQEFFGETFHSIRCILETSAIHQVKGPFKSSNYVSNSFTPSGYVTVAPTSHPLIEAT